MADNEEKSVNAINHTGYCRGFPHIFANLLLDSAILGSNLEGEISEGPIRALREFFTHFNEKVLKNYFGSELQEKDYPQAVVSLKNKQSDLQKIFVKENFIILGDLPDKEINALAAKVLNLKPGKRMFVFGGWSGYKEESGHDMLYEFVRTEDALQFRVINLGAGISHSLHSVVSFENSPESYFSAGKYKYYPVVYSLDLSKLDLSSENKPDYKMLDKKMRGFIRGLDIPCKKENQDKYKANVNYVYDNAIRNFETLGDVVLSDPTQIKDIVPGQSQISGTCVGKAAKNIVKEELADRQEYYWFKLLLSHEVMRSQLAELEEALEGKSRNYEKNKELIELLKRAKSNFARYGALEKIKFEGDVDKAKTLKSLLNKRANEIEKKIKALAVLVEKSKPEFKEIWSYSSNDSALDSPQIEEEINEVAPKPKEAFQSFDKIDYYKPPDSLEKNTLLENLDSLIEAVGSNENLDNFSVITAIEDIVFALSDRDNATCLAKKDLEATFELMKKLSRLISIYKEFNRAYYFSESIFSSMQQVTHLSLLVVLKLFAENNQETIPSFFRSTLGMPIRELYKKEVYKKFNGGGNRYIEQFKKLKKVMEEDKYENTEKESDKKQKEIEKDCSSYLDFHFGSSYQDLIEFYADPESIDDLTKETLEKLEKEAIDLDDHKKELETRAMNLTHYRGYFQLNCLKNNIGFGANKKLEQLHKHYKKEFFSLGYGRTLNCGGGFKKYMREEKIKVAERIFETSNAYSLFSLLNRLFTDEKTIGTLNWSPWNIEDVLKISKLFRKALEKFKQDNPGRDRPSERNFAYKDFLKKYITTDEEKKEVARITKKEMENFNLDQNQYYKKYGDAEEARACYQLEILSLKGFSCNEDLERLHMGLELHDCFSKVFFDLFKSFSEKNHL